jgi:hypothetical protein
MSEQTIKDIVGEVLATETPVTDQPQAETEPKAGEEKEAAANPVDEEKEHKTRVQKRIDQLTRDKYELKQRVDALEAASKAANAPQRPTREQFQSDEEFTDALVDYKLDQRMAQQPVAATPKPSLDESITAARSVHDDFDATVSAVQHIRLPEAASDAIMASKQGAEILYALGKDPDTAERIAGMSPGAAAFEIGMIAAKINYEKTSVAALKKVSSAPAPITPIQPKHTAEDDPSKMTDAQFAEWRRKQIKQRNGR